LRKLSFLAKLYYKQRERKREREKEREKEGKKDSLINIKTEEIS